MIRYLLVFAFAFILIGCEDSENAANPMIEFLDINQLNIDNETLQVGETTIITAVVDYSGIESTLVYRWTTTGGKIDGQKASVVYQAPDTDGTYTITLKVTDGFSDDEASTQIRVVSDER